MSGGAERCRKMPRLRKLFLVIANTVIVLGCAGGWFIRDCLAAETASQPGGAATKIEDNLADRTLSDQQREIIRRYVLRGANVSIIPLVGGEPEAFAIEIASALKDAGAAVSFGTRPPIQDGQTGVIVFYDHTVPPNASVFLALQRAGLKPADYNIPGVPVVNIKVGPRP